MIDVSVIINLHNEGRICQGTIESVLQAVRLGEISKITTEIVCVIDNGDQATFEAINRYRDVIRVCECALGDLSGARNFGVSRCKGNFITFIDGDDLWGDQWITRCMDLMQSRPSSKTIVHPQINFYFGEDVSPSIWVHPNMDTNEIDIADIFIANRWTALCFAARETFEAFPYVPNAIVRGFGYEDWLWHIQTILNGFDHISCPKTCHFIRKKGDGSLLAATKSRRSIPDLRQIDDLDAFRHSLLRALGSKAL